MARLSDPLIVVGMHRSGTSATMAVLAALGMYPGAEEDLLPADAANEEGYWENRRMVEINTAIMRTYGLHYYDLRSLPANWSEHPQLPMMLGRFQEVVGSSYDGHAFWGWKDPRTTLVLPLVEEALRDMGLTSKYLLLVRHPNDVAKSLSKRDGLPNETALGLWLHYTLTALRDLPCERSHITVYRDVLADPRAALEAIFTDLAISCPGEDRWEAARQAVREDLAHSLSPIGDLNGADPLLLERVFTLVTRICEHRSEYRAGAYRSEIEDLWGSWERFGRLRTYAPPPLGACTFSWLSGSSPQAAGAVYYTGDLKWFQCNRAIDAPPGARVAINFGNNPGVVFLANCRLEAPDGRVAPVEFMSMPGAQVSPAPNGIVRFIFFGGGAHTAFRMPTSPGPWKFCSQLFADLNRGGATLAAQTAAQMIERQESVGRQNR